MTAPTSGETPPFRITIAMRGIRPLYVRANLLRFLAVFENGVFAPDRWSKTERGALPYSRGEIEGFVRDDGQPMREAYAFIKRSKIPKYECMFQLSERAGFRIEFNPKLPVKYWESIFQLAHRLGSACEPDWGAAHVWRLARPLERSNEPASQDELDGELLMRGALLASGDYYWQGPSGLVMRTYIGPHFLKQLGEERVRALPIDVTALPWGGYQVDLVQRPWEATLADLLGPWRKAMEQLRPAGVLAVPRVEEQRFREFQKAPNSVITAKP